MKLRDYLAARPESRSVFAQRAEVPLRTLNRACLNGSDLQSSTALRIIEATRAQPTDAGGTVTLADLVRSDRLVAAAAGEGIG